MVQLETWLNSFEGKNSTSSLGAASLGGADLQIMRGQNRRATLEACRALLNPGCVIVAAENVFDGIAGANLPSWLIYQITSVRHPWFGRLFRRCFNTAGVGVCFLAAAVFYLSLASNTGQSGQPAHRSG
jgi:hypothetical protein